MTVPLTRPEVEGLHAASLALHGGSPGLRDENGLESALAQPAMAFGGVDAYPNIPAKAAALGYSLLMNHPFVDGNKRVSFLAMTAFARLNGYHFAAPVDETERVILDTAAGTLSRDDFAAWVAGHVTRTAP